MWFHHNNLVSFKVTLNALLIAKVFIMSIFVLALKGITTLMESRFWKTQVPPPKQSKFPAKPSCETKIGECTWNAFVHKSLYLFSRWHLSTAFIFALLSSPWLDRHTVVTFGGKPAWEVSAFCSSPHLCVQDLRHSYSFLKAPADPSIPQTWAESFVQHHCSSPIPVEPTPPALRAGCVLTWTRGGPAQPKYGLALPGGCLLSESLRVLLAQTCSSLSCHVPPGRNWDPACQGEE